MTDITPTPASKKRKIKILAMISAALILILGVNHFIFKIGETKTEVTVTDSTIVVKPTIDTVKVVKDTLVKKDTTKK